MKRSFLFTAIFLSGCVAGLADYDDEPTWIQRADIINKNNLGITIEHSSFGKKIAFRLSDEHCATMGKLAVYQGASTQYGPDVISTWVCQSE
ncbi:hypothetical protein N9R59_00300 [Porticoccaceae bacterium]|nr:hypothetical protein [Porticoccaceae bacterium]